MIHLIAAVGDKGQIGLDGVLPWHDPQDLKWFKEMTMGQTLLVGHNTAQTLPKLPGRLVVTLPRDYDPREIIRSIKKGDDRDLWIIGGAKTYAKWMPYVDRFHINRVSYTGPADAWFPHLFPQRNEQPFKTTLTALVNRADQIVIDGYQVDGPLWGFVDGNGNNAIRFVYDDMDWFFPEDASVTVQGGACRIHSTNNTGDASCNDSHVMEFTVEKCLELDDL